MNQGLPKKLAQCEGFDPAMDRFRFCPSQEEASFLTDRDKLLGQADSPAFSRVIGAYSSALDQFHKVLEEDGAKLLLVIIPDRWQVNGYRNAVSSVLVRETSRYGIDAIDMASAFRISQFRLGIDPFLGNGEDHCSPWGNRLLAKSVADALLVAQNQQRQPVVSVRPPKDQFDYANPIRARLWVDKNMLLRSEAPESVQVRVDRAVNLSVEEETSFPINVLKKPAPDGQPGEIFLRVDAGSPLKRLDLRLTRKSDNDLAGVSSVQTLISRDGSSWSLIDDLQSDRSGKPGTYEQFSIVEVPFRDNHPSTVWLKIRLTGAAAIYSERPGEAKPERYFDLYLYKSASVPGS